MDIKYHTYKKHFYIYIPYGTKLFLPGKMILALVQDATNLTQMHVYIYMFVMQLVMTIQLQMHQITRISIITIPNIFLNQILYILCKVDWMICQMTVFLKIKLLLVNLFILLLVLSFLLNDVLFVFVLHWYFVMLNNMMVYVVVVVVFPLIGYQQVFIASLVR